MDHFDEISQSKMLDARLPELQSKPSVLQVFVLNKFPLMREDHFKNFTVYKLQANHQNDSSWEE